MPKQTTKAKTEDFLDEYLEKYDGTYQIEEITRQEFSLYVGKENISWDDLLPNNKINMRLVSELADETVKLLEVAQKAEKQLAEM